MRRCLATAFAAVLLAAACPVAANATTSYSAPQSARTPEGAHPAPLRTLLSGLSPVHISVNGLRLIERFEGYSRCAYWDPYGRVWTAGYGQTRGISARFCFTDRLAAEVNLRSSIESEYQWAVRGLGGQLTQNAVDALDSFAYNLGAAIFTGTLREDLKAGRLFAASRIMLLYDHAGGVVLPGLQTRREAEVRLLLIPERTVSVHQRRLERLHRDYRRRSELRRDITRIRRELTAHRCRSVHGPHAYPRCPQIAREGRAAVNAEALVAADIRRLHREHVW